MIDLSFFERVASLYRAKFMYPLWENYELDNTKAALSLFLEGYAFTRNVYYLPYPEAAKAVIKRVDNLSASEIWKEFLEELKNNWPNVKGPNEKRNPLYHTEDNCSCLICVLSQEYSSVPNIVKKATEHLRSKDGEGVKKIHDILISIRGIGPKIAALFLRDVADLFSIAPPKEQRYLLQPVDIWVRGTVRLLAEGEELNNDKKIATWVCDNAMNPERANQGIWYWGSQVVGSRNKLQEALTKAPQLVEKHIDDLRRIVQVWDKEK